MIRNPVFRLVIGYVCMSSSLPFPCTHLLLSDQFRWCSSLPHPCVSAQAECDQQFSIAHLIWSFHFPITFFPFNISSLGTSLVIQWLRFHTLTAEGLGLIPGQGTINRSHVLQKIGSASAKTWCSQINDKYFLKFPLFFEGKFQLFSSCECI